MIALYRRHIINYKNLIFHLLIIFITEIITGCQKEIEVRPVSGGEDQLFIECILYPGERPRAYISKIMPYFAGEVTPQQLFAREVSVSIIKDLEVDVLKPDSTFDRYRCRWIPFYEGSNLTEYNKSYELLVHYKDHYRDQLVIV